MDTETPEIEGVGRLLADYEQIGLAFVFGSMADGSAHSGSDLDVAVAGREPLPRSLRAALHDELAVTFARPVDIVDLSKAPPPLLRRVLTTGRVCLKRDVTLYANLLRKLWYDQADIMPNHDMVLRRRREAFLGG